MILQVIPAYDGYRWQLKDGVDIRARGDVVQTCLLAADDARRFKDAVSKADVEIVLNPERPS